MRKASMFACFVSGLAVLAGCAADDSEWSEQELEFRCLSGQGAGLIGLDLVDMAGTPSVSGVSPNVYSNVLVALAGSYDLDGSAISGGKVTISGNTTPGGSIIENATPITVADPSADVLAAKSKNDNAQIPCIVKGNKCASPVTGGQLVLASQQNLTLKTGTYYFVGISISGQAKLNVDGKVVIYLNGGATFNGGAAINPSADSLRVISSSTAEIKLNGGGSTTMQVFAPYATVRFAGTQGFRGTALGKELRLSGTTDLYVTEDIATTTSYVTCLPEPTPTDKPTDIPAPLPD